MASLNFNKGIQAWANGDIDFGADTFYLMLVTSTYTPDKDAHDFRNDVTNEVVGTAYTAGGKAITATVSLDTANDRIEVTYGTVTWAASTITARAGVIYKHRGGASSADEVVHYVDFGADISSTGADFVATPSGVFRVQN
jgi:hypothetical protein